MTKKYFQGIIRTHANPSPADKACSGPSTEFKAMGTAFPSISYTICIHAYLSGFLPPILYAVNTVSLLHVQLSGRMCFPLTKTSEYEVRPGQL